MLDEAGIKILWQQIDDLWVQPEIENRKRKGSLPDDFVIRQCLIRMPQGAPPIVEFNNEIHFVARVRIADNVTEKRTGQAIFLREVKRIEEVLPPEVNDRRVAFVYLFWDGQAYSVVFDFSPNWPEFEEEEEFELGEYLAAMLQQGIVSSAVRMSRGSQLQLAQIGLWPVTSLLPYPIVTIIEYIMMGAVDDARALLLQHCNGSFIEELVETWRPILEFETRQELFNEAVFAHKAQKYHLSIYTLIPQLEGTIADWLHRKLPPDQVRHRVESRVEQWRDAINSIPNLDIAYRDALLVAADFMLDDSSGPLQKFSTWPDRVDPAFPSRHAVSHGKYIPELFTEENSIKLFLLLDTVCQFMMFYEEQGSTNGN